LVVGDVAGGKVKKLEVLCEGHAMQSLNREF
jgi:hypothetical protein